MPIEFAEYDPVWPELARQGIAEPIAALPGLFSAIEHVGSTAVPGLAAKPIIDLMAATDDLDRVVGRDGDLRLLGYEFRDAGMPGRLFYRRGADTPPARRRSKHLRNKESAAATRLPERSPGRHGPVRGSQEATSGAA